MGKTKEVCLRNCLLHPTPCTLLTSPSCGLRQRPLLSRAWAILLHAGGLQVVGGLTGNQGMKERGKAQEAHGDNKQVRCLDFLCMLCQSHASCIFHCAWPPTQVCCSLLMWGNSSRARAW
jgi:hypothetical protein